MTTAEAGTQKIDPSITIQEILTDIETIKEKGRKVPRNLASTLLRGEMLVAVLESESNTGINPSVVVAHKNEVGNEKYLTGYDFFAIPFLVLASLESI